MSHEIETSDVAHYAAAEGVPWHKLGKMFANGDALRTDAAAAFAALYPHGIEQIALQTADGHASDHMAVREPGNGRVIATVGPRTVVPQPAELGAILQPLVDAGALVSSAFTMRDKRKWAVCLGIGRDAVAPGDTVTHYLALSGSLGNDDAIVAAQTTIRAVCANTVAAGRAAASALFRTRKTRGATARLADHMGEIARARKAADATVARFRDLANVPVRKRTTVADYLVRVFGEAEAKARAACKPGELTPLHREIETLQIAGRGTELDGVKGTAWGLHNALTEYLTHVAPTRGRRDAQETRVERTIFGSDAAKIDLSLSDEMLAFLREQARTTVVQVPAGIPIDAVFG